MFTSLLNIWKSGFEMKHMGKSKIISEHPKHKRIALALFVRTSWNPCLCNKTYHPVSNGFLSFFLVGLCVPWHHPHFSWWAQPRWGGTSPSEHWDLWTLSSMQMMQGCQTECLVVFFDPLDCSPPGSSVHEILQATILERVAISSSRGSFWPRDWSCISCESWVALESFTCWVKLASWVILLSRLTNKPCVWGKVLVTHLLSAGLLHPVPSGAGVFCCHDAGCSHGDDGAALTVPASHPLSWLWVSSDSPRVCLVTCRGGVSQLSPP